MKCCALFGNFYYKLTLHNGDKRMSHLDAIYVSCNIIQDESNVGIEPILQIQSHQTGV
jgi:hypothetical protein